MLYQRCLSIMKAESEFWLLLCEGACAGVLREPWVLQLAEPAMLPQLPATGLPTDPSAYSGSEVLTGPGRKENLCQGEGGGGKITLDLLLYMPMGIQKTRSTVLAGTPCAHPGGPKNRSFRESPRTEPLLLIKLSRTFKIWKQNREPVLCPCIQNHNFSLFLET